MLREMYRLLRAIALRHWMLTEVRCDGGSQKVTLRGRPLRRVAYSHDRLAAGAKAFR